MNIICMILSLGLLITGIGVILKKLKIIDKDSNITYVGGFILAITVILALILISIDVMWTHNLLY